MNKWKVQNDIPRYPCDFCGKTGFKSEQRWSLNNYHGLTGLCCPTCYEKVSHDPWGNPNNPEEYTMMFLKYGK